MQLNLIVARAANQVIGRNNELPWRLKEDMAYFKRTTMGHPVIMGRRTWESILARSGKPLSGRRSIVVTRNANYAAEGATVVQSLDEAIAACGDAGQAFVIGGVQLYREALPRAHVLHVTEIGRDFEGDTWFPVLPAFKWEEVSRERHRAPPPEDFDYDFVVYRNSQQGV